LTRAMIIDCRPDMWKENGTPSMLVWAGRSSAELVRQLMAGIEQVLWTFGDGPRGWDRTTPLGRPVVPEVKDDPLPGFVPQSGRWLVRSGTLGSADLSRQRVRANVTPLGCNIARLGRYARGRPPCRPATTMRGIDCRPMGRPLISAGSSTSCSPLLGSPRRTRLPTTARMVSMWLPGKDQEPSHRGPLPLACRLDGRRGPTATRVIAERQSALTLDQETHALPRARRPGGAREVDPSARFPYEARPGRAAHCAGGPGVPPLRC